MPNIIEELRGKRNEVGAKLNALNESNKDQKWSKEDQEKWDTLINEHNDYDNSIRRQEQLMAMQASQAAEKISDQVKDSMLDPNASLADKQSLVMNKYLRNGLIDMSPEERQVMNTLVTTTQADGGYTVPSELSSNLLEVMKEFGAMRRVANVTTSATGITTNWPTTNAATEKGRRIAENETASDKNLTFGTRALTMYKYTSDIVTVTNELLQDTTIDLLGLINNTIGMRIARIQDEDFTKGTGSNMPYGVIVDSSVGHTAASATALTWEDFIDLEHSLDPAYRKFNPKWMFHDLTLALLKKLKDSEGRPLWQPSLIAGEAPSFMGYGYEINQEMPTAEADALSVAFGDFKRYTIRDATGVTYRRFDDSKYGEKDCVGFLAFMRSSGRLMDIGGAVKTMQMASA